MHFVITLVIFFELFCPTKNVKHFLTLSVPMFFSHFHYFHMVTMQKSDKICYTIQLKGLQNYQMLKFGVWKNWPWASSFFGPKTFSSGRFEGPWAIIKYSSVLPKRNVTIKVTTSDGYTQYETVATPLSIWGMNSTHQYFQKYLILSFQLINILFFSSRVYWK